jgi:hypothetical protein
MSQMIKAHVRLTELLRRALQDRDAERGDVPGWVLITIMTAGLVAVIWGFADDKLVEIFDDAVSDVSPQGN